MNRFNKFIEKRSFKKIFVIYIIFAILCGICTLGAVGYVYKDKISFALEYERANEALEKSSTEKAKSSLEKLSKTSDDIIDILLLDNSNNIIYSSKNTNLAWNSTFELKRDRDDKLLTSDLNPDTAFQLVKKDKFMLSSILGDFKSLYDEYDEENSYLNNFQNKKLYLLSTLGKKHGDIKAYIITDPSPMPHGALPLKLAASVFMLLFMIYWIIIALRVYQNALKCRLNAAVWGIITLFTNLAGVLVYTIFKHTNKTCGSCGAVQPVWNVFCTVCGNKIGLTCPDCSNSLKPNDNYCAKCGKKIK